MTTHQFAIVAPCGCPRVVWAVQTPDDQVMAAMGALFVDEDRVVFAPVRRCTEHEEVVT